MFRKWGKVPRVLLGFAIVVAGPVCTYFIALRYQEPLWVAQAIGMIVAFSGAALITSVVRESFRNDDSNL
jgi:hypothetical protein